MTPHTVAAHAGGGDEPNTATDRGRVEEILADPRVAKLIRENQKRRPNIVRAAEKLQDKPDAHAAVLKAAHGLVEDRIKVFLSYKKKEERTARKVVDALRSGTGKLDIFWMVDIPKGTEYRQQIDEETGKAHWFILLLPDPRDDWDWCLFESGLFKGRMLSCDKLFCLYHPNIKEPPTQLEGFNGIPATKKDVTKFVQEALVKKDALYGMDPLNEHAEIDAIATRIVEAISPPAEEIKIYYRYPCVTLEVADADAVGTPQGLDSARILEIEKHVPEIFGRDDMPSTWGKLIQDLPDGDGEPRWLSELRNNVGAAARGQSFEDSHAPLRDAKGTSVYRVQVLGVSRTKSGLPTAIQILFVTDISALNLSPEHDTIATLAMLLRMAFRFRWEILEKYGHKKKMGSEDLALVQRTLDWMQEEASAAGHLQPQKMLELFDENEQKTVIAMIAKWNQMRNDEGTGTLDVALRNGDAARTRELLDELSPMNKDFLIMASRRFTELTEQVKA